MTEFTCIAIDTSKHVFTLHGVTTSGAVVRRDLRRADFLPFFAKTTAEEVIEDAA